VIERHNVIRRILAAVLDIGALVAQIVARELGRICLGIQAGIRWEMEVLRCYTRRSMWN
jgi:hypothetical protein